MSARRSEAFLQDPLGVAAVSADSLALLVGVIELVLVFLATVRAAGHRAPFICLLLAVPLYTVSRALDLTAQTMAQTIATEANYVGVSASASLLLDFSYLLALAASFAVLWNRRTCLPAQPTEGLHVVNRVVVILLLTLLALVALTRVAILGVAVVAFYSGKIRQSDYESRILVVLGLRHVFVSFLFPVVVYLGVSAFLLRARITRASARDKPTNVVAFFLFPLWLFHFAYALLADIVAAPHSAQILMRLVSTAVNLLLPCLIFLAFIILGMRRSMWDKSALRPYSHTGPDHLPPSAQAASSKFERLGDEKSPVTQPDDATSQRNSGSANSDNMGALRF